MQSRSRLQGLLRQVTLVDRFTKFLALTGNVHFGETNLVLRVFSSRARSRTLSFPVVRFSMRRRPAYGSAQE